MPGPERGKEGANGERVGCGGQARPLPGLGGSWIRTGEALRGLQSVSASRAPSSVLGEVCPCLRALFTQSAWNVHSWKLAWLTLKDAPNFSRCHHTYSRKGWPR